MRVHSEALLGAQINPGILYLDALTQNVWQDDTAVLTGLTDQRKAARGSAVAPVTAGATPLRGKTRGPNACLNADGVHLGHIYLLCDPAV